MMHEAENLVMGANDTAIGAFLLTSWGLPKRIVDAVAMHYAPSKWGQPAFDVSAAVHLAYASEQDRKRHKTDVSPSAFDLVYTDVIGISSQLSSFIGLCPEAVSQSMSSR